MPFSFSNKEGCVSLRICIWIIFIIKSRTTVGIVLETDLLSREEKKRISVYLNVPSK